MKCLRARSVAILLRRLPAYLKTRRWFQGKDRTIRSAEFIDDMPIADTAAHILLGKIEYGEGDPEFYVLPGSVATGEAAEQVKERLVDVSVAQLQAQDGSRGILYSAVWDPAFLQALLGAIAEGAAVSRQVRRIGRHPTTASFERRGARVTPIWAAPS